MATTLNFSPSRDFEFRDGYIDMLLTPEVKKDLTSLFLDEDSGLGMDDNQEQTTQTRSNILSPLDFCSRLKFDYDKTIEKIPKHPMPTRRRTEIRRPLFSNKRKLEDADTPSPKIPRQSQIGLRRAFSFDTKHQTSCEETDAGIADDVMNVVDRLVDNEDLTGDGVRTFCLPTVKGKHQDLKSITPQTMAEILNGKYENVIASCRIIDCRYPYEYNGGHIQGAENLYTREMVKDLLRHHKPTNQEGKRDILVFHCEFSSERGPKMSRFLRAQDREMNKHWYPALTYPEVYLLHGGYKAFYEGDNKTRCHPMNYTPMVHQKHTDDLRHFRSRSKSWAAEEKRRNVLKLRF